MTSSAKQTERPAPGIAVTPRRIALAVGVVGALPILAFNDWSLGSAVVVLLFAWAGLMLAGAWMWEAGWSAATEDGLGDVGFELTTRSDELEQEKRSLFKAIKEIDFDRRMGKMSDEDCEKLTRRYRKQAITVIKALEEGASDEGDNPVEATIESELRARRSVAQSRTNKTKSKTKSKTKAKTKTESKSEAKSEAEKRGTPDDESKSDVDPDAETETETEARGDEAASEKETNEA